MGQYLLDYGPMPAKAAVGVAEALPGAVMDPFMRAYQLSQDAADAGGFSNLPSDRVARDSLPMALMTFGGAPLGGGLPKGALGQSGTSPTLWEGAKDYAVRGAMPGAAAGGLYEASQGGSRGDMLEGAGVGAALGVGALGVKRGLDAIRPDDLGRAASSWMPRPRGGPPQGKSDIPPTPSDGYPANQPRSYRAYGQIPASDREPLRDVYRLSRLAYDRDLSPRTAYALKERLRRAGVDAPVTPNRVQNTNTAVNDFIAREGRMPTSDADWATIWSKKTLALPATAGLGAAATSDQDFDPVAMGRYLMMQQF